ncbi:hypothetical protein KJK32_17590 [Streptomyces sp. JCM17656]|nr:hypothetical protein KJK32_17590 [Streptomyces sp. JCM17656]
MTGGELPPTAREDLRKAVQSVEFDGAMGRVGFDRFGDAVTRQMEIYQVSGGRWKRV